MVRILSGPVQVTGRPPPCERPRRYSATGVAGGGAAAIAIAAAVAIAAPSLTEPFEGFEPRPYLDPAKVRTVCYGETEGIETRVYSKSECGQLLRVRMARDYAPRLLACLPQLIDQRRRNVFAAMLDASYNAGWSAVCQSRMARSIRAGDWTGACTGLRGWYVTARNRQTGQRIQLAGLVRRRNAEAALCLQPVA